jgi:hypothetical protein
MTGLLTPQRQTAGNGLLDQPRRVDDRVAGLLGLDPSIQRGAILPFGRDASGEMVMAWPEMALDTLKSLMLPGHVMQGGEFTPRDVTEMALDAGMLSTVAPAPAGAKRMFGGISAKNAPLDDLAKAEAMEKAGEAADDIWRATGWGRGADQKWRFEIDDSGATGHEYQLSPQQAFSRATADALFSGDSAASARLEQMKPYASKSTADLLDEYRRTGGEIVAAAERGDIERALSLGESRSGLDAILDNMRSDYGPVSSYLKHDDLNAAYPDVSGMHARVASDDLGGARGQYFQDSPVRREQIVMNEAPTWSGPRSTALHELQHAVQQREGFARGGSPEYGVTGPIEYPTDLPRWDVLDAADKIRRVADQTGDAPAAVASKYRGAFKIDDESMQQALDFANSPELPAMVERGRGFAEMKPFEAYRRLAGEVEARNVQSRMDMDAATRRATPPWSTEDVPRGQQIVRGLLGDSGPQMSASLPMDEASRMARADEMFPVEAYHATTRDFPAFSNDAIGTNLDTGYYGTGHYSSPEPKKTEQYIIGNYKTGADGEIIPEYFKGSQILPLRLAMKNPLVVDKAAKRADTIAEVERLTGFRSTDWPLPDGERKAFMAAVEKAGFDGVQVNVAGKPSEYVVANPSQIRSRFAAFDPARKDSTDILASYLGVPGIGMLDAMPQDDQSRERRGLLNN